MSLEPWSLDGEEEVTDFAMYVLEQNRVGGFSRDDNKEIASLFLSIMRYFEARAHEKT